MPGNPIRILLVHGTWPEGPWQACRDAVQRFFTSRGRDRSTVGNKYWFQDKHIFHVELERGLIEQGFDPTVMEMTWSGANSFADRSFAAAGLAIALKALPAAGRQIIIGHSHGGSVALQAINMLDQNEVELVTLATPFLRVERFASNKGLWGMFSLWWMSAVAVIFILSVRRYGANTAALIVFTVGIGMGVVANLLAARGRWINENVVKPLVTKYRGPRIQCIRGIADEAGLAVNAGIMGAWVGRTLLTAFGSLVDRTPDSLKLVSYVGLIAFMFAGMFFSQLHTAVFGVAVCLVCLLGCAILASLAQWALGGELAFAGLQFITAVESTPDVDRDRLEVVTLGTLQDTTDGLRHSVYNHPDCIRTIVEGIVSRDDHSVKESPSSSAIAS